METGADCREAQPRIAYAIAAASPKIGTIYRPVQRNSRSLELNQFDAAVLGLRFRARAVGQGFGVTQTLNGDARLIDAVIQKPTRHRGRLLLRSGHTGGSTIPRVGVALNA